MTSNPLKPKVYATRQERQRAMEDILIELTKFKVNGLHVCIPQVPAIMSIYEQAENAGAKEGGA